MKHKYYTLFSIPLIFFIYEIDTQAKQTLVQGCDSTCLNPSTLPLNAPTTKTVAKPYVMPVAPLPPPPPPPPPAPPPPPPAPAPSSITPVITFDNLDSYNKPNVVAYTTCSNCTSYFLEVVDDTSGSVIYSSTEYISPVSVSKSRFTTRKTYTFRITPINRSTRGRAVTWRYMGE